MPNTKYIIELTETDRKSLTDIAKKGNSPARTIMRANILLAHFDLIFYTFALTCKLGFTGINSNFHSIPP